MPTGKQSEDFENSESIIEHPASGATTQNGAVSVSLARRGGGPRTVLGKLRSKCNARKHAIFAEVVVLPSESRAQFDRLWSGLREDFAPLSSREEKLVEMLAVIRWRQRRWLIAEGAEIQAGREFIEWDETQRQMVEVDRISQENREFGLIRRIANPEVLQRCLDLLGGLRRRIEHGDFNTESDENILRMLYLGFGQSDNVSDILSYSTRNLWRTSLVDSYQRLSNLREEGKPSEHHRNEFLGEIAGEIKRLERYKQDRASTESNRMKLEALRRSVPDSPRLELLLRYGASMERSYDRVLCELERVQAKRLGQPVPPPINVNVSS